MHVGGVEVEFVAGAGNRVVPMFGGGECCCDCDIGIGVSAGVALRGWDCELLGKAAECVCSNETSRFTFEGSLVRNARFADLMRDFWRKSRTKCLFWRLHA